MSARIGSTKKKFLSVLGIYALVVGLCLILYALGSLDSWQEKIVDRFFTREAPEQSILIIAIDDESLNEIGQWPWPREVFAQALRNIPNATAIGIDINFSEPSRVGANDDSLLAEAFEDIRSTTPVVLPLQLASRGKLAAEPLPLFAEFTQEGFVNLPIDSDGVVRKAMSIRDGYPSFSSLLAGILDPASTTALPDEFRIHYVGPPKTFLTIPFSDLLAGRIPPQVFNGAILLVGVTATDLHDTVDTPFGSMPGVEAHANAIETITSGSFLRPMPPWAVIPSILLIPFLTLLLILRVRRVLIMGSLLVVLGGAFNVLGLALFSYGIIYPVLYLNLAFLGMGVLAIAYQYTAESRDKRFIRKTFQYYLTPEVVSELIEHPEKLVLGGERKEMTILFSDIRDFTSISERLSPPDLTRVMNEYLSAMTDVVMENRGVVDKYIGDAVMAFWGAPLENPSQALDACRSAMLMSERLGELNARWKNEGLPEFAMRIGIATGSVVVGNMGSSKRFNYTVMGDEVNFASRLEGLNKAYGTECIVSEATRKTVSLSEFLFRELDTVRVKGKQEARTIYELLSRTSNSTLEKQLSHFTLGRDAYAKGDWDAAAIHFEKTLELGEDGPSREMLRRVNEFKKKPPEGWDGVYVFGNK